jgi:hypothetical protein
MPLIVRKQEGETWREAALRYAKPWSPEAQVGEIFDREVASGTPESRAAWNACHEWDVLDYTEDAPEER